MDSKMYTKKDTDLYVIFFGNLQLRNKDTWKVDVFFTAWFYVDIVQSP